MKHLNQICEICGSTDTVIINGEGKFNYKGEEVIISDYEYLHCNTCEEEVVETKSAKRAERIFRDHQRKIDGLLTSDEIKEIRKNRGLTQEELAEIIGGGKKAFARYENGTVTQSRPTDSLLYVIDKHPEIVSTLRNRYKRSGVTFKRNVLDSEHLFAYSPDNLNDPRENNISGWKRIRNG